MSTRGVMSNVEQAWLAKGIAQWFECAKTLTCPWSRNSVGIALKAGLEARGNWKARRRGNPAKGGKNARAAQLRRFGRAMIPPDPKVWKRKEEEKGYEKKNEVENPVAIEVEQSADVKKDG